MLVKLTDIFLLTSPDGWLIFTTGACRIGCFLKILPDKWWDFFKIELAGDAC